MGGGRVVPRPLSDVVAGVHDTAERGKPVAALVDRMKRSGMGGADTPQTFGFLLLDGLPLMSLACAIEPLRALNRLLGREAYAWRLASVDGTPIVASNGIELATHPVDAVLAEAEILFVCSGVPPRPAVERRVLAVLRRAARRGVALGAVAIGSDLLARAGLLNGYRCTIHWENRAAFVEAFPDLNCTGKIFEVDRNRVTCAGGTATMDLMLKLIGDRHGRDLARQVANQFQHQRIRAESDEQRAGRLEQVAALPSLLRDVIARMTSNIETPVAVSALARSSGISPRQLERLFLRHVGISPARYYLALRTDRARELLLYSESSILDVAVACGFSSTSRLSQWFRHFQGQRPSELRMSQSVGAVTQTGRAVGSAVKQT